MCNTSLLEEIAEKPDVRDKIVQAFKDQYQKKVVDDETAKRVIQYLI